MWGQPRSASFLSSILHQLNSLNTIALVTTSGLPLQLLSNGTLTVLRSRLYN